MTCDLCVAWAISWQRALSKADQEFGDLGVKDGVESGDEHDGGGGSAGGMPVVAMRDTRDALLSRTWAALGFGRSQPCRSPIYPCVPLRLRTRCALVPSPF